MCKKCGKEIIVIRKNFSIFSTKNTCDVCFQGNSIFDYLANLVKRKS